MTLVAAALAAAFVMAAPASAGGRSDDAVDAFYKRLLMSQYTQTSRASFDLWNHDRARRGEWSRAHFDWSTDFCSNSPDRPLGFNFMMPCYRHDWGYRNYHDEGLFASNKTRLDNAFYADLLRVCDAVSVLARPACNSLAWTYYQAVAIFGVAVSDADLQRAAQMLEDATAASAGQETA